MESGRVIPAFAGEPRRWTGRMLMAVILGLGIWNLIASLIDNLVVPALGTLMGQDGSLPASFTRNYDYPDLFVAVLKFWLAGIVAVSIHWFLQRERKTRVAQPSAVASNLAEPRIVPAPKAVQVTPVVPVGAPQPAVIAEVPAVRHIPVVQAPPVPVPARPVPMQAAFTPVMAPVVPPKAAPIPAPVVARSPVMAPVQNQPTLAKVEETKPKKKKQVYYNIVGEPVEVDE
jgi:large-conductance mechanosensitive channel